MKNELKLGSNKWTDNDFEQMSWHDNKIHAIAFDSANFELFFDIDYIHKWMKKENQTFFEWWVAPTTLVFKNVYNLNISGETLDFTILEISKNNPSKPKNVDYIPEQLEYHWTIETTNGEITFTSVGYVQHSRKDPVLIRKQHLGLTERGGISFEIIE